MVKRNMMLFVVSIIMVVFGGIGAIMGLIALIGSFSMMNVVGSLAGRFIVASMITPITCGFQIFVAIVGIRNANKPFRGSFCFILGTIILALAAINVIFGIVNGANIVMALIGLVLPVLYTIGADQLRKTPQQPQPPYNTMGPR